MFQAIISAYTYYFIKSLQLFYYPSEVDCFINPILQMKKEVQGG